MVRDLLKEKEMFQIDLYSLHTMISQDNRFSDTESDAGE